MKQLQFVLIFVSIFSCSDPYNSPEYDFLTKRCEMSIESLMIITYGFHPDTYDSVLLQTFKNNSRFDTLIKTYKIPFGEITDTLKLTRELKLHPKIGTDTDLKIVFSDGLTYKITEILTFYIGTGCPPNICFECGFGPFKVNNKETSSKEIIIQRPGFKYSWE